MRAAAELDRIGLLLGLERAAHGEHADLVAVFLAEHGDRALFHGLVGRHQARGDVDVLAHDLVHFVFDALQLVVREGLGMREVEAQAFGPDERALLRHVRAEHVLERRVQEMRRRVIGARGAALLGIDAQLDRIADGELAARNLDHVDVQIAELLLGVDDFALGALAGEDRADIADLAAAFAVERRLVGDDAHGLARAAALGADVVLDDGCDRAFGVLGVVAQELGRPELLAQREPERIGGGFARSRPRLARFGRLRRHGGIEAFAIDAHAAFAQRVFGQIAREAEGVVELEGDFAGKRIARFQFRGRFVEQLQPARQRLAEAGFLELQGFADERFGAFELGIGLAHLGHERRHEPVHQRILGAQDVRVTHAAAHDAAEHVAAAFVRRAARHRRSGSTTRADGRR